jgi:hypothetical protein
MREFWRTEGGLLIGKSWVRDMLFKVAINV